MAHRTAWIGWSGHLLPIRLSTRWRPWQQAGLPILLLALLLAACGTPGPRSGWAPVAAGIEYRAWSPWPDSAVHALRLDLSQPGLRIALSPPQDAGRPVPQMATAASAAVAVNASFFERDFTPRGLTMSEGRPWPHSFTYPQSSPLLACDAASRCRIQLDPPFEWRRGWHTVVAGTPWLVREGRARAEADDARCPGFCIGPHPRVALGLDETGRWLHLVVIEGRRDAVRGASLAQTAELLRALGARTAFNLDGGGSIALEIRGRSVAGRPFNEPAPRPVANALLVFAPAWSDDPSR